MLTARELVPSVCPWDTAYSKQSAWLTVDAPYDGRMTATTDPSPPVASKSGRKTSPRPNRHPDLTPLTPLSAVQLGENPEVPWRRGGVDSRGIGGSKAAPYPPGVTFPSPGLPFHPRESVLLPGEGDQGGGVVRATLNEGVGPIQSHDSPMTNPRLGRRSCQHPAEPSS